MFEAALADRAESPYVWPDAARMYTANRYGIVYRGKSLFARTFAETLPEASEAVRGAGCAGQQLPGY